MATSTCVKCGSHQFETKEADPKNSMFKMTFVQCASCGGVVGVMDFYNIGQELQLIKKRLGG
jgi:predicted nucleic-acid-binding Zn-ribbon protein